MCQDFTKLSPKSLRLVIFLDSRIHLLAFCPPVGHRGWRTITCGSLTCSESTRQPASTTPQEPTAKGRFMGNFSVSGCGREPLGDEHSNQDILSIRTTSRETNLSTCLVVHWRLRRVYDGSTKDLSVYLVNSVEGRLDPCCMHMSLFLREHEGATGKESMLQILGWRRIPRGYSLSFAHVFFYFYIDCIVAGPWKYHLSTHSRLDPLELSKHKNEISIMMVVARDVTRQ